MKNFYFIFFSLAILISSESIRADGHGEKKEVVEEKTEDASDEKEEDTTEETPDDGDLELDKNDEEEAPSLEGSEDPVKGCSSTATNSSNAMFFGLVTMMLGLVGWRRRE